MLVHDIRDKESNDCILCLRCQDSTFENSGYCLKCQCMMLLAVLRQTHKDYREYAESEDDFGGEIFDERLAANMIDAEKIIKRIDR